jgi:hypothetical protein
MHPLTCLLATTTAAPIDPGTDPGGFLSQIATAIGSRNWVLVAALAVLGVVWALRTWGARWVPWFGTDRGGAVLVLSMGILGAVSAELAAGKPPTLAVVVGGLSLGFTAAGGWSVVRRLAGKSDAQRTGLQ